MTEKKNWKKVWAGHWIHGGGKVEAVKNGKKWQVFEILAEDDPKDDLLGVCETLGHAMVAYANGEPKQPPAFGVAWIKGVPHVYEGGKFVPWTA